MISWYTYPFNTNEAAVATGAADMIAASTASCSGEENHDDSTAKSEEASVVET